MPASTKHPTPPPETTGFSIFIRASYTTKYNFAVANYNAVSTTEKIVMRDFFVLLYRSVVAVAWIVAMGCAVLTVITDSFFGGTIGVSVIYIALSIYNFYVFFRNRDLLNATRLLRAKVAGPDGLSCEWVSVPVDSASANERLSTVEQTAIDNVRKEFAGQAVREVDCLVYTNRYAKIYPTLPKELLIHFAGFLIATALGIALMVLL